MGAIHIFVFAGLLILSAVLATCTTEARETISESQESVTPDTSLTGKVTTNSMGLQNMSSALALLSKYDIVFVLDESTSMLGHDCSVPSHGLAKKIMLGSNILLTSASAGVVSMPVGQSRWTFAVDQVKSFLADTAAVFPDGLSVYTYGLLGHTYKNVTAESIDHFLKHKIPFGGTYPSAPLGSIFKQHFKQAGSGDLPRRPLLVVILSDCGFNYYRNSDLYALHSTFSNAIKKMSNIDELTVCFCKTGISQGGQSNVQAINNAPLLFGHKLKYNLLRYIAFKDLRQQGLTIALAQTLAQQPHNDINQ